MSRIVIVTLTYHCYKLIDLILLVSASVFMLSMIRNFFMNAMKFQDIWKFREFCQTNGLSVLNAAWIMGTSRYFILFCFYLSKPFLLSIIAVNLSLFYLDLDQNDYIGQSSWLQIQRCGFVPRRYQIFWEVGLERGPLSLVSTIEELLERKSSGSGLGNRDYSCGGPLRWPRDPSVSKNWH
jgi:hypothetical protein